MTVAVACCAQPRVESGHVSMKELCPHKLFAAKKKGRQLQQIMFKLIYFVCCFLNCVSQFGRFALTLNSGAGRERYQGPKSSAREI